MSTVLSGFYKLCGTKHCQQNDGLSQQSRGRKSAVEGAKQPQSSPPPRPVVPHVTRGAGTGIRFLPDRGLPSRPRLRAA